MTLGGGWQRKSADFNNDNNGNDVNNANSDNGSHG